MSVRSFTVAVVAAFALGSVVFAAPAQAQAGKAPERRAASCCAVKSAKAPKAVRPVAKAKKAGQVPACCVGGNCCAKGACCSVANCCKADKSCCDTVKGVCTAACGCPTSGCCAK